MTNSIALRFRLGDLAAIGLVLALIAGIAVFFMPRGDTSGALVQVYLDGALVREERLDADMQFAVQGDYENIVSIADGRVAIVESDCPGSDCVHSGSISAVGRSIVCLPNRVELRITGEYTDEVDFVVE